MSKSKLDLDFFKKEVFMAPKTVAIIMDGNGRWAKKRGLPRTAGTGWQTGNSPHGTASMIYHVSGCHIRKPRIFVRCTNGER